MVKIPNIFEGFEEYLKISHELCTLQNLYTFKPILTTPYEFPHSKCPFKFIEMFYFSINPSQSLSLKDI